MNKRGQIYILAAILLAVVIYGLSTIVNITQQEEIKGDFKTLAQNYEIESSKLINSVLQKGGIPVDEAFANFTFLFTSYSKAKSPNFHLFYALAYGDKAYFGNFMDQSIIIYIPCPTSSCSVGTIREIPGCLSNISAQMSFEGLNIGTEYIMGDLEELKGKCVWSKTISGGESYCAAIGGMMYNLSIEKNVPKLFSLSRLKSGEQVLNSVQGEVGQEQVCSKLDQTECEGGCRDACCWDLDKGKCLEGACAAPEGDCDDDGTCDSGETCSSCPNDCKCCDDGTRAGSCSAGNLPWYCKKEGDDAVWVEKGCKNPYNCQCPGDGECQQDGSCCALAGGYCDGDNDCCSGHYCENNECKVFTQTCSDGTPYGSCSVTKPLYCDSGNLVNKCGAPQNCGCPADKPDCQADGSCKAAVQTCTDGTLYGSCSVTKPLYCDSGNLVNKCGAPQNCGCPAGKPNCQADGSCKANQQRTCRRYYTEDDCGDCPNCDGGWIETGDCYKGSRCDLFWKKRYQKCYQDYKTACKVNPPSCNSGEDQISIVNC